MRFLMVDRLTRLEPGDSVEGFKCWSMSDDVFRDHFPGTPIVPGVFLIESMAQMVGFLIEGSYYKEFGGDRTAGAILSIIHKAKFRKFVVPGERVDMRGRILSMDRRRASCAVEAHVEGELRVEADLSFVIILPSPEDIGPELEMQRGAYRRFVMESLESDGAKEDDD